MLLIVANPGLVISKSYAIHFAKSYMKFPLPMLIVFFFLTLCSLHSQDRWRRLTTDDGLSSNRINTIFQTENGDIWIGTDRGIDRYNGIAQRTKLRGDNQKVDAFLTTGAETLFARSVSRWTEAGVDNESIATGQILIGTLWFFDGESWNRDPISDEIGLNRLNDWPISLDDGFAVHKDEKTWIATPEGLVAYDGHDWRLLQSDEMI